MTGGDSDVLAPETVPLLGAECDAVQQNDGSNVSGCSSRAASTESLVVTVSDAVEKIGMGRLQFLLFVATGLSWVAIGAGFGAVALVAPAVRRIASLSAR